MRQRLVIVCVLSAFGLGYVAHHVQVLLWPKSVGANPIAARHLHRDHPELLFDSQGANALSEADLAWGEAQLRRMIAARPRMGDHLSEGDPLWEWTVHQFAGAHLPVRVNWRDDEPEKHECDSQYRPDYGLEAFIRVRKHELGTGKEKSFNSLWSGAVFELYNLRQWNEFTAINQDALLGKVSRSRWIRGNAEIEFKAMSKRKEFYQKVWEPYCRRVRIEPNANEWWAQCECDLDDFLSWASLPSASSHNWYLYWADYYDKEVIPYLKAIGKYHPLLDADSAAKSFLKRWARAIDASRVSSATQKAKD